MNQQETSFELIKDIKSETQSATSEFQEVGSMDSQEILDQSLLSFTSKDSVQAPEPKLGGIVAGEEDQKIGNAGNLNLILSSKLDLGTKNPSQGSHPPDSVQLGSKASEGQKIIKNSRDTDEGLKSGSNKIDKEVASDLKGIKKYSLKKLIL